MRHPKHQPPLRWGAAAAYDPIRKQVVMFGGGEELDDMWAWTGTDWKRLHPAKVPSGREGPRMAFDPVLSQLVLFGGRVGRTQAGDTWSF